MSQTVSMKKETLKVPGASLYYEVRGAGPVLVMMPGGPADAGAFGVIADILAAHYTVMTYDPRGLSRSKLDGTFDDEHIVEVFADDVHRLLAAVTKEKAFVFGSSGGAVIGLELVTRHPDQLDTFVSHEPPSPTLQPDSAHVRSEMERISEIYSKAGIGPAVEIFSALTRSGPPPDPAEQTPQVQADMMRMMANMDLFFGPYMLAIARYEPDFAALKNGPCRIVAAVGDASRGEMAHDGGLGLAKRLGTEAAVFPGDHGGFASHAAEFAVRLREILEG